MKHILVPIDGSDPSLRAVEEAVAQQKAFGADVTLVNVVSNPYRQGVAVGYRTLTKEQCEEDYPEEYKNLKNLTVKFEKPEEISTVIIEGAVAKAIAGIISDGDYDFVIMGTEGLGHAMKRFLMGSVTKYVLEHVDVPVLVVR